MDSLKNCLAEDSDITRGLNDAITLTKSINFTLSRALSGAKKYEQEPFHADMTLAQVELMAMVCALRDASERAIRVQDAWDAIRKHYVELALESERTSARKAPNRAKKVLKKFEEIKRMDLTILSRSSQSIMPFLAVSAWARFG